MKFTASHLAPLTRRAFRLLWIGQTVSSGGDALVQVALVFAVLRIGGNAIDIGTIAAVGTVTRVALILVGGVWADRLKRQFVMLTSDVLRAAVQAILATLLITGRATVWDLGIGAALFGAADAFFGPASAGLIPETVPADQLQRANSLMTIPASFLQVGGPAAAGVLVAAFQPGVVFAVDAITFVVSAVSLGLLRVPARTMSPRGSFGADLAAGWQELASRPWYWINLCAHACYNFAVPAGLVLGPVIAARQLGGASAWGAISASFAAGAVAGGIIGLRIRPRRPLMVANLAGVTGGLPALAFAPPLATWLICVASALAGAGLLVLNSVWSATMQQLIPDQVRSRVDSYDWLISLVAMPAGFALVGPLARVIGDAATLTAAAVIVSVPVGLIVLVPGVRAVRRNSDGSITGPAPRPRAGRAAALIGTDGPGR
ncbi:MAG: MFS transporter [Streptosporangiaceae bacterium]